MLFLRRHVLPLLRASSPPPSPIFIYHRACLLSTSTSASAAPFSLEDYLVTACGLAPAQARKTAQKVFDGASKDNQNTVNEFSNCRLNSASNPDPIIVLLSGVGLSNADIADIVVVDPVLLEKIVNLVIQTLCFATLPFLTLTLQK
jgi:mTERF domain-containing protein